MSRGMWVRSSLVVRPGVPRGDGEAVGDGVSDGDGEAEGDRLPEGLADVDGSSLAVPIPSRTR